MPIPNKPIQWHLISSAPADTSSFIALGDNELAIVWRDHKDHEWHIRNIPGGAERLGGPTLSRSTFHSWCSAADLIEFLNRDRHPEYYMFPSDIGRLEDAGGQGLSVVHLARMRRR